jgi:WD40 repeat protein
MRQIGLLPAGCQQVFNNGVACTAGYVCYASSVAIYFLDPDTFSILKIIAYNTRTICCFSINPMDPNRIVVGSIDGSICAWNVDMEDIYARVGIGASNRSFMDWDCIEPDTIVLAVNTAISGICVHVWKVPTSGGETEQPVVFRKVNDSRLVTSLKCSPLTKGLFVMGCSDGSIIIDKAEAGHKMVSLPAPGGSDSSEVRDLQWDVKSNLYLLVAYSHVVALWDIEIGSVVHTFDKQGTGICSLAWMGWTAGNFISSNPKTGILKIWNVSQRQAVESIRLGGGGVLGVAFSPTKPVAFCTCADGSVIAYDFMKREVVNSTFAGHTDTVFDCCFSPTDPNVMATCSFDGTIKMWNITELALLHTFAASDSTFYSCAWSPCGKLLVCCTLKGEVIFWNIENGRAVVRYHHHKKASYSVRWNPFESGADVVCSTSADGSAVVFEIPLARLVDARSGAGVLLGSSRKRNSNQEETTELFRIQHSDDRAAYGCAWCPTHEGVFCVGFDDSLLRVYNYKTRTILFALKGHSERVFSCAWSPLVPGLLATGSDDRNIALWQLDLGDSGREDGGAHIPLAQGMMGGILSKLSGAREVVSTLAPTRLLTGHKSKVRALGWNHEHADVLQSGSWDSTIKIW